MGMPHLRRLTGGWQTRRWWRTQVGVRWVTTGYGRWARGGAGGPADPSSPSTSLRVLWMTS